MPPADGYALIPNAAPPAKRRKCALSWSADEKQFALWLIAEWNKVFKGLPGGKSASWVRGNTGAAVRFYRRQCAMPAAERFSREAIVAGVRAYADNPANKALKPPAWRYFKDWIEEAEDRIAAELARIGWKATDSAAQQARDLLDHLELGRLAREANANKDTLIGHVRSLTTHWARRASKQPREAEAMLTWLGCVRELHHRLRSLAPEARATLFMRASLLFSSLAARPYHGTQSDNNILGALALAILDLDQNRPLEPLNPPALQPLPPLSLYSNPEAAK